MGYEERVRASSRFVPTRVGTLSHGRKRPLGPFFGGLELTSAQHQALLAVAVPTPRESHPMGRLLTAFANDGFRATMVVSPDDLGEHVKHHLSRNLRMTQTLLRVLDDDQRAKLARRLERAPT